MKTITIGAGGSAHPVWRRRWLRNALIVVVALFAVVAVLGFAVVPRIAKSKIEALAQADLGRRASVGKVTFNPFTLHARLADFKLSDRDPSRTLFAFAALDFRVSPQSLWKLAPVIDEVMLTRPRLDLVRGDDGRLDVDDIVDRPRAGPAAPAPRFAVDNIEIVDGTVTFDDRMHRHVTTITGLRVGIPFLSSLPHDAKIRVTPHIEGVVDGSHFASSGSTNTPFADVHEATLEIDLDALKLADYASYATLPEGLKLASGALTTRLELAFVSGPSGPRRITLSGSARLDGLSIVRRDGSELAAMKSLAVELAKADLLGHAISLARVSADSPHVDLRRATDGRLEVARLLGGGETAAATPSPWTVTAATVAVHGGGAEWTDASVSPVFRAAISNLAIEADALANRTAGGTVKVALDTDLGAHVDANATLDVPREAVHGSFTVSNLGLAPLAPYYAQALDVDVRRGTIGAAATFDAVASTSPPALTVTRGKVSLDGIEAALRGERQPFLTLKHADVAGIAVDLSRRSVAIDELAWSGGTLHAVRLADGTLDLERIVPGGRAEPRNVDARGGELRGVERRRDEQAPASERGVPWSVTIRHAALGQVVAEVEDRVPKTPARLRIVAERVAVDDFGTAQNTQSRVDAVLRVGKSGRVAAAGRFALAPAAADLRIDARGIDLVAFEPYVEVRTNIAVTRGTASAKGRVAFASPPAGPVRTTWQGNVEVADFASLDRPENEDLLRWRSLTLTGVDIVSAPLAVGLGTITLDDFYARIILGSNATLNLQQLLVPDRSEAAPETSAASGAAAPSRRRDAAAKAPGASASGKALPVSIAGIRVENGEVEYSDFFVKPNYRTRLSSVTGTISALNSSLSGDVSLAAKVQGAAPVGIHGTINPFADNLQLDLTATASDVDLPPLTPYSVKYAGYGIEKGELSMEVHYKVDDRKLTASNRLRLDQLTFGGHVDSPTATKLPVLLAVSLLKDRNGVIDLDLPIEGTLDDPKFSIWRVVVQVFVNLITKAVTAPFALLGSIGGGSHEELAWVGFAPGRADLAPPALAKLETLAKALADRPGLRLDVAGRAVPDLDREALKRVRLERALRARKLGDVAAEGASAPPADEVTISPAEYPKYLDAVYRDTKIPDKPRNFLGIAKEIPPAQMEALLLASYQVDDAALTALANERAEAVKAWLVGPGKVAPAQVFVVAPKLGIEGIADKGVATRADFALR